MAGRVFIVADVRTGQRERLAGAIDKYMPDAQATRPDGGLFISVTLPEGTQTTTVRTAAVSAFCVCPSAPSPRSKLTMASGGWPTR